jgi:hypothetical protein
MIALIAIILPFAVWANISLYQKFTEPTVVVQETVIHETIIIEEIITTLDLDQMRDTLQIDPTLEDELLAQCTYILLEETSDPMAGVIHYLERYWQGDACAALDHYWAHGWY